MKVGLEMSLTFGSFSGKNLVNLADQFIKFEPCLFIRDSRSQMWDSKKHKKVMDKYAGDVFLGFSDKAGNAFSAGPTNKKHSYFSVNVTQEKKH